MEPVLKENLSTLGSVFSEAKNVSLKTVAQNACGDWRFFARVENGSSFTIRVYDRALQWFSDHWPDDVAWPAGVPRPARKVAAKPD